MKREENGSSMDCICSSAKLFAKGNQLHSVTSFVTITLACSGRTLLFLASATPNLVLLSAFEHLSASHAESLTGGIRYFGELSS